MRSPKVFLLIVLLMIVSACKSVPFVEKFEDQNTFESYWQDNSWKSPESYHLESEGLKITTRPYTDDRVKVRTKRRSFGAGSYTWRIYIPQFNLNEQCSIGAFLYHSGRTPYELDFEIGSGKEEYRQLLEAKPNEAIVYCVSQYFPSSSDRFKVEMEKWADFKMELHPEGKYYLVKWYINNALVKTLKTKIKTSVKFSVHNSLENLHFMGDKETTKENYVLFDYFEFQPLEKEL